MWVGVSLVPLSAAAGGWAVCTLPTSRTVFAAPLSLFWRRVGASSPMRSAGVGARLRRKCCYKTSHSSLPM